MAKKIAFTLAETLIVMGIIGVVAAYLLYFVMLLRGMYDVEIRLLPYLSWIFN